MVAKERLEICSKCTYQSERRKKTLGYSSIRMDVHCTHCGCTLSAKTRCMSCSCPIGLWQEEKTIKNEEDGKDSEATSEGSDRHTDEPV